MDIGLLIQTLIQLYSLILVGFFLARFRIFDAHVNRQISSLVVTVTYPMMLLCSMMGEDAGSRSEAVGLLAAGFGLYLLLIAAAKAVTRILPVPAEKKTAFECMLVFGNTGFIGAPLAQSLYGDAAFFQVSLLHFAFFFYYNTYAVRTMSRGLPGAAALPKFRLRDLFSPGFVVTIGAVALYLIRFTAPPLVHDTLYMVGGMTTPLSMLVLGSSLAMYPFRESVTDPWTYVFSAVRLLVLPAITFGVCRLLPISGYFTDLAVLTLGMPAGSMMLMLALQLKADERFFTGSIFVSTLLSAVSLPVLAVLFLA